MKKINVFLLSLLTFLLIIIFTSPFLKLYEIIVNRPVIGGMGIFAGPSYFEGFFISYSFFVTLVVVIFGGNKKYLTLSILLGVVFLIQVISLESLIVSVGVAIVAWLISQAVLFLKKKIGKK